MEAMIPLTESDLRRWQKVCDELEALIALLGMAPASSREFSGFMTLLSGIEDDAAEICEEFHDRMKQAKRELI
jgi:hypothetical protein